MQSPPFGDGSTIQKQTFSKRRARRRLAIFALSAIFAGGIPLALVSSAPADSPAAQVQMSDADLLQKGMNQYDAGQYEEAVATLEKVNPKNLSDAGLTALNDALSKAELAASARVAARKEFELGEQSRQAHNPADAIKHYQAVVDNRFADEGTRQKAIEQLALAKAEAANGVASTGAQTPAESPKPEVVVVPAGQSNWSLYEQATADMNAGHFDDARAIFKQLEAAGYQPPGFNRAPADMLKEVDFRAGLSAPPRTGAQAYGDALYQYNHGNLLGARLGFEKAEQMGYQPAAGQPTPAQYLARLNPPDQTELTTPLAVAQPQVAVSSESATPAAENIPATQPTPNAEEQLKAETENQELQKERDQFRARGLVDLARQAYEENRKEEALSDYEEAANLDPTNEQAVAGVKELQEETGKTTASANIQQYTHRIAAEVEEIKFKFNSAIDAARTATAANNFAEARQQIESARVALAIDPGVFPVTELDQMEATIAQVDADLKNAQTAYQNEVARESEIEIQRQMEAAKEEALQQRENAVSDLITQSRQYIAEYNWAAALGVLDQILTLDPNNDYAIGMRQFVEDKAIVQDQHKYRDEFDENYMEQLNLAEEQQIPYNDILRYPTNWPDISAARDEEVKEERDVSREDQAVEAQLDKVLPLTLKFDNVAFSEAIGFLRDVTGANIFVNTRALDAAGIDPTTPITLPPLHGVTFAKALDTILSMVSTGTAKLSYEVDQGVITISTADELNQNTVIRVYDVRDLLVQPPNLQVDTANQNFLGQNTGGGGGITLGAGGGGGGGQQLNFQQQGNNTGGNGQQAETQQQLTDDLVKLIESNVAPDSWRDAGGTIGAIQQLQGSGELVITQTPENHQKVQDLLDKLREQRALMVTVDCRFLEVDKHFVEDVGLNLSADFNINRGPNSVWSTVPVSLTNNSFTGGITSGVPGSIGSTATGLSVAATYLDDFEVNLMLTAVEAEDQSTLVTAPRVTLFDNGTASIVDERVFYYVGGLNPVVAAGAVAYQPILYDTTSGVVLNVQATISADRKYVTLNIYPQLTSLVALQNFTFQTASSAPSVGGIGQTTFSSAVTATVQEPIEQVTTVRTLVSVPDGGTLLLGGVTIAGEAEAESGVPILSKIPFLKRLFTNRSTAKDDNILLILVKPTIIIQHEIEEKNFPMLSDKAAGD